MTNLLLRTDFPHLLLRGKVRDNYDLGDRLLIVATDRISAFDVVLPGGIPDKGRVLTQLSAFWFQKTAQLLPNHFLQVVDRAWIEGEGRWLLGDAPELDQLAGRAMVVRRAQRIDMECVVRGYLAGSAWAEYQEHGTVCGQPLPPGLVESQQLPQPIFTPSTKSAEGHDLNISFQEMAHTVGDTLAEELREKSLAIYAYADAYARSRGIIIADTKMEFGILNGKVILIDELLTPDSSRFWPADQYRPGCSQPSFDKQFVRDWLLQSGWDREPPAPELPFDVVEKTAQKYRDIYQRLTGVALEEG
ncbi:MAG: phosphoribosylaminoimidazolesuccinocarboxamide synthase [Dehalococcoidia bacterium]|nr:phosphoribosylaminoimidazolesuccinocarboxamide synthase [Dehalococcoidia bacterium]